MSRSKRKGRCGRGCWVCGHRAEARVRRQGAWDRADGLPNSLPADAKDAAGWDIVLHPEKHAGTARAAW